MTGPEHYAEAERLQALWDAGTPEWITQWGAQTLAAAQVHATLAQAAATVDAQRGGSAVWAEWHAAKAPHDHDAWCAVVCDL